MKRKPRQSSLLSRAVADGSVLAIGAAEMREARTLQNSGLVRTTEAGRGFIRLSPTSRGTRMNPFLVTPGGQAVPQAAGEEESTWRAAGSHAARQEREGTRYRIEGSDAAGRWNIVHHGSGAATGVYGLTTETAQAALKKRVRRTNPVWVTPKGTALHHTQEQWANYQTRNAGVRLPAHAEREAVLEKQPTQLAPGWSVRQGPVQGANGRVFTAHKLSYNGRDTGKYALEPRKAIEISWNTDPETGKRKYPTRNNPYGPDRPPFAAPPRATKGVKTCNVCKGTGVENDGRVCMDCSGTGKVYNWKQLPRPDGRTTHRPFDKRNPAAAVLVGDRVRLRDLTEETAQDRKAKKAKAAQVRDAQGKFKKTRSNPGPGLTPTEWFADVEGSEWANWDLNRAGIMHWPGGQ